MCSSAAGGGGVGWFFVRARRAGPRNDMLLAPLLAVWRDDGGGTSAVTGEVTLPGKTGCATARAGDWTLGRTSEPKTE